MSEQDFAVPKGIHTITLGLGDLNGMMRGKRIPASHWPQICNQGSALCASLLAIDMTSEIWDTPYVNFDTGYQDIHLFPITKPIEMPWEPGVAIAFARAESMNHQPVPIDPRQALIRQLDRAADMGYEIKAGTELEFFLLDPETMMSRDKGIQVYGLDRAAELEHVLGPIRSQINECGIPIEQSNPEFAPGQVEVNIRYDEALLAADRVVMFRSLVKQLAFKHGYHATFMAKPFTDLSGSGFHLHYSLWKDGKPAFADKGKLNTAGQSFMAGVLSRMQEMSVLGSATVNGYRRKQPDSFCPTNVTWGYDNRTTGIRVIEGGDNAVRIEKRDSGADANPYLIMAADIAAGLDGLAANMKPPPASAGNAYRDASAPPLPADLGTAIDLARSSDWLKSVLSDQMFELYLQQAERELGYYQDYLNSQISPVERSRYMQNF